MSETELLPIDKQQALITSLHLPFIKFNHINPLVAAATPLLLLIVRLKDPSLQPDALNLRSQIIQAIAEFEMQAKDSNCSPRTILAARYCLCTAIDETVLCTTWGSDSVWTQQTLLSLIQKETWGGERFFLILEKMIEEAQSSLPLLELIYILLNLGYEGKYYNENKMIRDEIRHRLFRLISMYHEQPNKIYPLINQANIELTVAAKSLLSGKKIAASTLSLLLVIFLFTNIKTYEIAKPLLKQLDEMGTISGVAQFNQRNSHYLNKAED